MGIRISEMEEATTFGADDYVPIVTNGTNKKALGQKIKDFIAGFFATKNGDNITDDSAFRTAIGINAANTPFLNTGTGMTAEDVQAGIEELNTSKANIDGSNIANPSAFRSAIGLNYDFIQSYDTKTIPSSTNNFYTLTNKITIVGGIWLLSYWAQFSDNATGVRILTLSDSQNSSNDIVYSKITNDAVGSAALTRMGNMAIFNTGGLSYDIYLNANQNSGSNMTVTGVLRALRLVN